MKIKQQPNLLTTAFCLSLMVAGSAVAKDAGINEMELQQIIPELQETPAQDKVSGPRMWCMVDTPRWDTGGYGFCLSGGFQLYATAVFRVDNAPANSTIYWSGPDGTISSCSSSSNVCSFPIRAMHSVTTTATVLDHSTGTFTTTTATAHYEGLW